MTQINIDQGRHSEAIALNLDVECRTGLQAAQKLWRQWAARGARMIPVDVEWLATKRAKARMFLGEMPDELCGSLRTEGPPGTQPSIFVNIWHAETRQRFTIAHELIHLYCGHGDSHCFSGDSGFEERQANAGAAALLMPESYVRLHVRFFGLDVERLARLYAVSPEAMRYRLCNLGLAGQKAADRERA